MITKLIKTRIPPNVRRALRSVQQEWRVYRIHQAAVRKAPRYANARGIKLNLGCGSHPKPGWINVDLETPEADLRLDLRQRLPFHDGTVARIYSEHFFEHLQYPGVTDPTAWQLETPGDPSEALGFLRECLRVLTPGGCFELVVPDVEAILDEYAARHLEPFPKYDWWGPKWCNTPMHCVNYVFRQGTEHKYAYDGETLQQILQQVGFVDVVRRPFDEHMEAENHRIGSLCIQATKRSPVAEVESVDHGLAIHSTQTALSVSGQPVDHSH